MSQIRSIQIYDSNIESPEVTIAIPTYKRGDLLIEAIESALKDYESRQEQK